MKTKKPIMITVTFSSKKEARFISQKLLEKKLVACAQILPVVESHYWWDGKIACSKEYLVYFKSVSTLFAKIEKEISSLHSYDTPEIIAFSIDRLSTRYKKWLKLYV